MIIYLFACCLFVTCNYSLGPLKSSHWAEWVPSLNKNNQLINQSINHVCSSRHTCSLHVHVIPDVCKTHAVQQCKEVQICKWDCRGRCITRGVWGYGPQEKNEFLG